MHVLPQLRAGSAERALPELWRGTSTPAASISRETAAIPGVDGASAQEARVRPTCRLACEDKEQLMTAASRTSARATGNVAPSYVHYDKFVEPADRIELSGASLKWYDLARRETPIPSEIRLLARAYLERESAAGRLRDLGPLGFAILHRCGAGFYFLLVSTWHNENELWESVYAKDGQKQPDFQPFSFQGLHRGTFCVWELAAVWYEQQAWKRFLLSARDEPASQAYLRDCYEGPA
jgi:hypothetical protein